MINTPAPDKATSWRLKILSAVLLPVWVIQSVLRSLGDGGRLYLRERMGFYGRGTADATDSGLISGPDQQFQNLPADAIHIWIHCASVGEVKTALPLIKHLSAKLTDARFTVTTLTPTGKELLQQMHAQFADTSVRHCYLPIDHGWPTKCFLQRFRPHCALIVETEIWPRLYHACYQLQVPIVIVNGRLSQKTERVKHGLAGKFIAPLLADALATVHLVLARSSEDAKRFTELLTYSTNHPDNSNVDGNSGTADTITGQPAMHVCGNLKDLATTNAAPGNSPLARPYCLLASTHDDEELRLIEAWQTHNRSELLVIVPRHPERGAGLEKQLQSDNLKVLRRSQSNRALTDDAKDADRGSNSNVGAAANADQISPAESIYIADTLGELELFYQHADVVFVGGSLVNVGGHNVFEAARAACAIVVGPHMHNFEAELSALQKADAIFQTETAEAAIQQLCFLLDNPQQAQQTGKAAAVVVRDKAEQSDVADCYMEHLLKFIDQLTAKPNL